MSNSLEYTGPVPAMHRDLATGKYHGKLLLWGGPKHGTLAELPTEDYYPITLGLAMHGSLTDVTFPPIRLCVKCETMHVGERFRDISTSCDDLERGDL